MFVAEGLCAFKADSGNLRINASEIKIIVNLPRAPRWVHKSLCRIIRFLSVINLRFLGSFKFGPLSLEDKLID